jgi:hypothetical protein
MQIASIVCEPNARVSACRTVGLYQSASFEYLDEWAEGGDKS